MHGMNTEVGKVWNVGKACRQASDVGKNADINVYGTVPIGRCSVPAGIGGCMGGEI